MSMLDKPMSSLTLRDSLKLNGVVFGGIAGIITALSIKAKLSDRKARRKAHEKAVNNNG